MATIPSKPTSTLVDELLSLGLSQHQSGNLAEARRIYGQVLGHEPGNASALHLLGVLAHQSGEQELAVRLIDQALAARPQFAEAWTNRGTALLKLKRYKDALESYDKALELKPQLAEALNNRGNALRKLKRHDEALKSYERALALKPDYAEALNNRGLALGELERYQESVASFENAIAQKADYAEAWNNRGAVLCHLRRYEEALASYDAALAIKPNYADAFNERGTALRELERYDEALASYEKALALDPRSAEVLNNCGSLLHKMRRYDKALLSYDEALAIKPDYIEALNNRGSVLQELRRYEEALASYEKALALKPDDATTLNNQGTALQELRRYPAAFASYEKALAARPDYAEVWSNRGTAYLQLKRYDEALACYRTAQAINPDYALAHFNEAGCRLLTGDFEQGWKKYEWRWGLDDFRPAKRDFRQPLWLGQASLEGKTILLHFEQGLGDVIQFARYIDAVARRAPKQIIVEVQPELKALFADAFSSHTVIAKDDGLSTFDYHCPFGSLPLAFGTRLETIPATKQYLKPPSAKVHEWTRRLGGARPRVGIAWSGNRAHRNDHNRSIPLAKLLPLIACGATLVSLQKKVRREDEPVLRARPEIIHLGAQLDDFADTAALISLLDIVISVDTSVAHLAGALGKPTWLFLPYVADWRWLTDRQDSPWYPTARLFRQVQQGDWDEVIRRVAYELAREVSGV